MSYTASTTTVYTVPELITPVYNKISFALKDSNYNTTGFKYTVIVAFLYGSGQTLYFTYYPRLVAVGGYAAGHLYMDISSILRSYINGSYYKPTEDIRFAQSTAQQEVVQYSITVKNGSTTLYESDQLYAWSGCPSYIESNSTTNLSNYIKKHKPYNIYNGVLGSFLNIKNYNRKISLNDYASVYFIPDNYETIDRDWVSFVYVMSSSGKYWAKDYNFSSEILYQFGVGPKNINESTIWDTTSAPLDSTDLWYDVSFYDQDGLEVFKTVRFYIECNYKYKRFKIDYQAQNGGYGYCLFGLKSFKSIKTKKETYNKYKNYYDNTGTDRNIIVYNNIVEGSYVLNTDWLEQLDIDEIEELLISPSLFLVDENNNTIPVYIESVEKIINDKSQDKLVQYEIEVREAINRNVIS